MIGKSFSECIREICEGKVREEDVEKIIASTKASSKDEWIRVISIYNTNVWRDFPEKAGQIAWRFINGGKVEQPRLQGKEPFLVSDGNFWITL